MLKFILSAGILALILACAGKDAKVNATDSANGEQVYKKYCVICHGQDGKLGLNGSKDISASLLTQDERIALIKHGKNAMTPFDGILSEQEIKAVASYTMQMK